MQSPYDSSADESLVSARVGRPSQPERILEEFPNLTVTDYLRYRVTGLLPDEIESGMKLAAREFMRAAEEARTTYPEVARIPDDYERLHTSDEVTERCKQIANSLRAYIHQEDLDAEEVANLVYTIGQSHFDCLALQTSLDPDRTLREFVGLLDSRINTEGTSPSDVVSYLSLAESLTLVDVVNINRVRELMAKTLGQADFQVFLKGIQIANVQDAMFVHLLKRSSCFDLEMAQKTVTQVLPAVFALEGNLRAGALEHSFNYGRIGSILDGALRTLQEHEASIPDTAVAEIAQGLVDEVLQSMYDRKFLCHSDAVKVLSALSTTYHADIPVIHADKLKCLCDLILEKKVKMYAESYPNVHEIKKLIGSLIEVAHVELQHPALVGRPWYVRLGDFLKKPFVRS